jgi:hypothetical protein
MFASLGKTLTAGALALAIAITSLGASTTPARADNDEAAAILGGLIALYAISRVIQHNQGNDSGTQVHRPPMAHQPPVIQPQPQRRVLPADCRRVFPTANGRFVGYNVRCTQNRVARPNRLPDQCIRQVRTERGIRNFYGQRCMIRNGWVRA